jgi:hypothetical protein
MKPNIINRKTLVCTLAVLSLLLVTGYTMVVAQDEEKIEASPMFVKRTGDATENPEKVVVFYLNQNNKYQQDTSGNEPLPTGDTFDGGPTCYSTCEATCDGATCTAPTCGLGYSCVSGPDTCLVSTCDGSIPCAPTLEPTCEGKATCQGATCDGQTCQKSTCAGTGPTCSGPTCGYGHTCYLGAYTCTGSTCAGGGGATCSISCGGTCSASPECQPVSSGTPRPCFTPGTRPTGPVVPGREYEHTCDYSDGRCLLTFFYRTCQYSEFPNCEAHLE